jgi:alpha-tubulin suppressor-like RCC1 family protein
MVLQWPNEKVITDRTGLADVHSQVFAQLVGDEEERRGGPTSRKVCLSFKGLLVLSLTFQRDGGGDMRYKGLLVATVLTIMAGLLPLFPASASASVPAPTITSFSPQNGPVGGTVTIEGTNLAGATSVMFGQSAATVLVDKSTKIRVVVPSDAITSAITVTSPGGSATSSSQFVVTAPLSGVVSMVGGLNSYCALLTSGGVDCWGIGISGQLGDGVFQKDSALAVAVVGVGGSGTLGGVASLVSNDYLGPQSGIQNGYCALLTSGGVDCWGVGATGELGNGIFYTTAPYGSAVPVEVLGVGGSGTLGGVVSLASEGEGVCALLTSGGVDCWGSGFTNGATGESAVPVAVLGVGGSGTLGGVVSLASTRDLGGSFCALLASGGVDCWGYGAAGQLGDGTFAVESGVPVAVLGVGGSGTLGGVVSLASTRNTGDGSFCALLTSGAVDCWGYGAFGQLGNGVFYPIGSGGSAVPVPVLGVGGSGTLDGVVSLASDAFNSNSSFCALLASGGVDCWGYGHEGELGDGIHYKTGNQGSAVPVAVLGVGGSGTLGGGVVSLVSDAQGYCSLLSSGGVDCWGAGFKGELGDGVFLGSAVPVKVVGVGGTGSLSGVASLASDQVGACSVLSSGAVDCWGFGAFGQLGDGVFYDPGNFGSAVPVAVITAVLS